MATDCLTDSLIAPLFLVTLGLAVICAGVNWAFPDIQMILGIVTDSLLSLSITVYAVDSLFTKHVTVPSICMGYHF